MKTLRAGAATLAAATALVGPVTAAAAAPTTPVQGVSIAIGNTGQCTLGFNDHSKGVSYTAAHCANRAGERVRLIDPVTGQRSRELGTITPSSQYQKGAFANDWATITWDRGVKLGANPYSGDALLTLDQVKPGEKVCFHGETTHKGTNKVSCGKFYDRLEQSFVTDIKEGNFGDSGGPIWVDGRGFIGVVSAGSGMEGAGTWMMGLGGVQKGEAVLWGAAPRNGAALDPVAMMTLQMGAAGLKPEFNWTTINPDDLDSEGFPDFSKIFDIPNFPVNPGDPANPLIPANPSSPANPARPAQPSGPANPGTPPELVPSPAPATKTQTPSGQQGGEDKSSKSSEKSDSLSSDADSMSSEKSTGEIVLIVVSVLAAVLPIVLQAAQMFM